MNGKIITMRNALIICFVLISISALANSSSTDIPVNRKNKQPIENFFSIYKVSMQSADFEVALYVEPIEMKKTLELKQDKAASINVNYPNVEMKKDRADFETADYKPDFD